VAAEEVDWEESPYTYPHSHLHTTLHYSLFLFSRGGRRGRKEDRSLLGKRSARHGNMALVIRMRREFVFPGLVAAALEKGRGISRSGFVGFRRQGKRMELRLYEL
jgi:hypothetical protein